MTYTLWLLGSKWEVLFWFLQDATANVPHLYNLPGQTPFVRILGETEISWKVISSFRNWLTFRYIIKVVRAIIKVVRAIVLTQATIPCCCSVPCTDTNLEHTQSTLSPNGYKKRTGQFLRALHVYSIDRSCFPKFANMLNSMLRQDLNKKSEFR